MNNVYVIFGIDTYKIKEETLKIVRDCSNIVKYDMTSSNVSEAILDSSMISFFDDKKIVICENSFFLTNTKTDIDHNVDELLKYISNPNRDSILIITVNEEKLDERKKIVKELNNKAKVIECKKATSNDLSTMAFEILKKENYKIDNKTLQHLVNRVGDNLSILENELNKLMLYKRDDKEISEDDINLLIHKTVEDDIFVLIDKLINKQKDDAFEIYNEMIVKGEEPIKIIVLLANQYRLIYEVKDLTKQGLKESDIASRLKIHPYRVKLAKEKSNQFTFKQLKDYLLKLSNLDIDIKTGKINKYFGIEMFFIQI